MKIFKHKGKGHYLGSVIIIKTTSIEKAEKKAREILDQLGLSDEELNVKEWLNECNDGVIYYDNGDY